VKNLDPWLTELTKGSKNNASNARPWASQARATAAGGATVDMNLPWGIDFVAWKKQLSSKGIAGDLDDIITRAKGNDADALAARGELRAAERAHGRGHKVEMLAPPKGKDAQGKMSPEAKLTRGGQELRLEVKTATEPPSRATWNDHADKANKQIKSSGSPGEISFDWTEVSRAGSDFPDQASIERFLGGKMTKDRLSSVSYFEIVWRDTDGKIVVTSRTRIPDPSDATKSTVGPITSVKR
jgi:hypothetical protein